MKTSLKFTRLTLASASMLALFGFSEAANAATQTFSVPVQFSLQLTPPSCTLTVGTLSTNSTTVPTAAAIPLPIGSTSSTPALYLTSAFPTAVLAVGSYIFPSLSGATTGATPLVPTASANCTSGTPYAISVTNDPSGATIVGNTLTASFGSNYLLAAGVSTSGNLTSLGMYLALSSVAGSPSTGSNSSLAPTPTGTTATATGAAQPIVLQAIAAASSSGAGITAFGSGSAGTYTYKFLVNLIF